jgi:hypothetical protein
MCSYYWRVKFLSYAVLKANAKQTPELAIMVFSAVNERWYFVYCVKTETVCQYIRGLKSLPLEHNIAPSIFRRCIQQDL